MNTELCGIEFTGTVIKEPAADNEFIQNLGGQIVQKSGNNTTLDRSDAGLYAPFYDLTTHQGFQQLIPDYFTMMACRFNSVLYKDIASARTAQSQFPRNESNTSGRSVSIRDKLYAAFSRSDCPVYHVVWEVDQPDREMSASEVLYASTYEKQNWIVRVTNAGEITDVKPFPLDILTKDTSVKQITTTAFLAASAGWYTHPDSLMVPHAITLSALPGSVQFKQAKFLHNFLASRPETVDGIREFIYALQFIKICCLSSGNTMLELKSGGVYDIPVLYLNRLYNMAKVVFSEQLFHTTMAVNTYDLDTIRAFLDQLIQRSSLTDMLAVMDNPAEVYLCGPFVAEQRFSILGAGNKSHIVYEHFFNLAAIDEYKSYGMPICPPSGFDYSHPELYYAGRWIDLGFSDAEKNSIAKIIFFAAGMNEKGAILVNSLLDAALQKAGSFVNALSDPSLTLQLTPEDFDYHYNAAMMIDVEASRAQGKIVMKSVANVVATSQDHAAIAPPDIKQVSVPSIPVVKLLSTQEVLQQYQPLYELEWSEGTGGTIPSSEKGGGILPLIIGAVAAAAGIYYSTKG